MYETVKKAWIVDSETGTIADTDYSRLIESDDNVMNGSIGKWWWWEEE